MLKKIFFSVMSIALSSVLFLSKDTVHAYEKNPKIFSVSDEQNYQAKKTFKDVLITSDYYQSIHKLRDLKIINGYENGNFNPQSQISRKQAALLIERLDSNSYVTLPSKKESKEFNDFNWWDEGYEGLNKLYQADILEVDKKGNILPNAKLTRGEMAKIIVIAFNLNITSNKGSFTDISGKTIEPYVETLLTYEITNGYEDGTFKPQEPLTRAHYSEFIFRALKQLSQNVYVGDQTQKVEDNFISNEQYRWANNITSFMLNTKNETYLTVDISDEIIIQTYSKEYELLATKKVPLELPLFGTFYSSEDYYYIAYGQENKEEDNQKEVIRIVKYDRDFNRISALSINGGTIDTVMPFSSSVGRMAEENGKLVFHTSRKRYASDDGLNHQSQLTFVIDSTSMQIVNDTSLFQKNHVSHSFNQYVLFDENKHVLLDHGDAYPRALVLHKGDGNTYEETKIVNIPGATGANQTGVSLGGFEKSSDNYLMLYNEIDHAKAEYYTSFEIGGVNPDLRDIKLAVISKNSSNISINQLATYTNNTKNFASLPTIVKITNDEFIVLWQEFDEQSIAKYLKYVKVNGNGQIISDIQTKERMYLSYIQPVYKDGIISWYVNQDYNKFFYSLDVSSL